GGYLRWTSAIPSLVYVCKGWHAPPGRRTSMWSKLWLQLDRRCAARPVSAGPTPPGTDPNGRPQRTPPHPTPHTSRHQGWPPPVSPCGSEMTPQASFPTHRTVFPQCQSRSPRPEARSTERLIAWQMTVSDPTSHTLFLARV